MGGRAMLQHGIETERKLTVDHERIQSELIPIISEMFNTEVKGVKYFHKKETHGDLDLLILNHGNLGNVVEKLRAKFGTVNNNGNVFSFEYDKYQVDIIPQPTRNWVCCSDFFNYDPVGNLIGKIAHKFGLKYGFSGLVYPFRNFSGVLSTDIVISKDSRKIFEFLGFDYDTYLKGFDTVEEIFEYVINSKYFNFDNFLMEHLNAIDRKRNNKRATYQGFIEYVNSKYEKMSNYEYLKPRELYIPIIDEFFPEAKFVEQLNELKHKDEQNKIVSERFNGTIVMDWTGLKNKELGQCLFDFKKHIEDNANGLSFKEWIIEQTSNINIENVFFEWLNNKTQC